LAFVAYAAKNAKVRIGAFTITANAWNVDPTAARLKTTNFESAGFEEGITGIRNIKFTIELDDNAAQNTFDIPIKAGTIGTSAILLYENDTTSPFWSITSPHYETLPMKAGVEDSMKLTISGSGNGQWLYPTGVHSGTT
jgi:hypothetical protein